MTADLYQQAKAIFTSLLELDDQARHDRLEELRQSSPELANEVRSLLDYHTAQSLVVPQAIPKIRTRSTLSTTYQAHSLAWLYGPARSLLIALPLFVTAWIISSVADQRVRSRLKTSVATRLNQTVDDRLAALQRWEQQQLEQVTTWSQHPDVAEPIRGLVKLATSASNDDRLRAELENAPFAKQIENQLCTLAGASVKFAVWDRKMLTLADWKQENSPDVLGSYVTPSGAEMLSQVLAGKPRVFLPQLGRVVTSGYQLETDEPLLMAFVPIYGDSSPSTVIAALMLRGYGIDEQYSALLEQWSGKPQSETYLLNKQGALLTPSRYGTALDTLDIATDRLVPNPALLLRDPGVDLLAGEAPEESPAAWPPTLLVRQVTSGIDGANTDGYRNYVGQPVVGAWRWLGDHQIGIAVEEDYEHAFAIATWMRTALFWISVLFTSAVGLLTLASGWGAKSKRKLRDISEVGPYQVQELLGEGGMGQVYLAEHALLCRQSAVKVLTKGDTDLSVISRFEREVQLASQLTHPNTIAIYDFGRNKDGLFYYAMEYINGAHLGQLVEYCGPIPPGRCIYILQQLCRALREAHQAGVVHRDIKPQNIMVCDRGGEPDFVKLFDYGLVKAFVPGVSQSTSQTKIVVGTPRFMAPERLNSPWLADPRVDVYSVGALAYFLLTAQMPPLVTVSDDIDSGQPGIETLDLPPSVVEFGSILSICLSVEPASRPSNMNSLMREFDELSTQFPWTRDDSEEWWSKNQDKLLQLVQAKRKKLMVRSDPSAATK